MNFSISTDKSSYLLHLKENKKINSSGDIHKMYVCDILNITPKELEKWKTEGFIPVSCTKEFKKWGKLLVSEYFSYELLLSITPEMIAQHRLEEKLKINLDSSTYNIFESLRKKNIYYDGFWYKIISVNISDCHLKIRCEFKCDLDIKKLPLNAEETVISSSQYINIDSKIKKIKNKLDSLSENKEQIIKKISYAYESIEQIKENTFKSVFDEVLKPYKAILQKQEIIQLLKIDQYDQSFPIARNLKRKINIVTGPTNSGKTYQALEALKKATSGVYLSPLRLLAMEIYDKLNSEGIPCNLITGEEHIITPGAEHTAATVEMMHLNKTVDVAIIDECQMVCDKQRGWAWTAALVGVPAKEVFAISNTPALEILKMLFTHTNEEFNIFEKQRLTPLETSNELVSLENVTQGDAIIAFTRKDVLSYAALLKKRGLKVSVIYGSLSPEIRRRQAELFCSKENSVVVATDAIGMGINLPIKRILFATIEKYDGSHVRELNSSEVHQIAGRAGRFGIYDIGYVSLLKNKVNNSNKLGKIKNILNFQPYSYINNLDVSPNNWHIEQISTTLKTKDIKKILIYFSALHYNSLFKCINVQHMCELYDLIKEPLKKFSLLEQYRLLCAPIEIKNEYHINFYENLLYKILNEQPFGMELGESYSLDSAEQEAKNITLFCWLSFNYPFMKTDNIKHIRHTISKYIEKALIKQNMVSFSQMIEPYIRKNYNYAE